MKPAIFNTAMVRAILDGRKTNTRRPFSKYLEKVIKYAQLLGEIGSNGVDRPFSNGDIKYLLEFSPYKVGDIIYVRETFNDEGWEDQNRLTYKADVINDNDFKSYWWKPSIHMPKEFARLFLRVKDVRIERLNEISEEDGKAEGCWYGKGCGEIDPPLGNDLFPNLWESIYGNGSFDSRYVWVIEFERISKEDAR